MEKSSNKVIAICALVVGVLALAIGFATYTATLTIGGSGEGEGNKATIQATDTFSPEVNYVEGSPKCYVTGDTSKAVITGANVGTASGKSWTGISVPMEAKGSVTCEAQVENESTFIAYLYSIAANSGINCNVTGLNANDGPVATQNVDDACDEMSVTVTIGADNLVITDAAATNDAITGNTIAANGGTTTVYVTITQTGNTVTDGRFNVNIPTISHTYKTED